jgi:hypothetical protein
MNIDLKKIIKERKTEIFLLIIILFIISFIKLFLNFVLDYRVVIILIAIAWYTGYLNKLQEKYLTFNFALPFLSKTS